MTSVDSGVETGNDSNDGVQLENLSNQSLAAAIMSTENKIAATKPILTHDELFHPMQDSRVRSIFMSDFYRYDFPSQLRTNPRHLTENESEHRGVTSKLARQRKFLVTNMLRYTDLYRGHCNSMQERRMKLAVTTNNVDLMKDLLEKGYSPNYGDYFKRTPLHWAACRGYTEIVRLLLDYGANPNQVDSLSNTPLHLAAVACKYDVITLLLEAGANVLSSDRYGHNPLQLAQSKLRLIQSCLGSDMNVIKDEVNKIINMLLAYLKKQNNTNERIEELSLFCSRISLSNTQDQVQDDLNGLLASIDALSLTT